MALASIPTTESALFAGCARRIETTATGTFLILDDGRRLVMPGRADHVGAHRCRRSLNHVGSVRIDGTIDRMSARIRGIGNRLPIDLAVPLATALALIDAGVPAVVHLITDGPLSREADR